MLMNRLREQLAATLTRDDVTRLIASLVLATMLWGWVSLVTDPEVTRPFRNLALTFEPVQGDLLLVTSLPPITVRLTGPESVIEDVSPDEIEVSIDTSTIDEPGQYTLPVRVDAPEGVRKTQAVPDRVDVQVEETRTENFPLEPEIEDLPETDARQVGQLQPEVSQVTVSGRESAVERVARVELPISIGTRSRDFEGEFAPIALDAEGNAVPEVEISPDQVEVLVPISRRGRSVAALVRVQGAPAEGFEIVERRTVPSTVQVDGPPEALSSRFIVFTDPVDVTGATQTITQRVALDATSLPPGVEVIDPADGVVEVVVQVAQSGVNQTLPDQTVTVVGLAPGLDATVEPGSVAVTVVATDSEIQALEADDVTVTVDVSGLGPGTHDLTPKVAVPANMRWVESDPETVSVTIERGDGPTATPVASPPASPLALGERRDDGRRVSPGRRRQVG